MTVILLYSAAGVAGSAWATTQTPPHPAGRSSTLTQADQVRRLGTEASAKSRPVRLKGVVTVLSGFKDAFFFNDGTAGISVEHSDVKVSVGDQVELTGATGPGLFAPIVVASHVHVLGRAALPVARRVTFADMIGGEQDSQWIDVQGIVHSVQLARIFDQPRLILRMDVGGGTMRVLLEDFHPEDSTRLIDATLRIRGVCITDFNDKRQFVGVGLIVSHRQDVTIVQAPASNPFAAPNTPIRNALQFGNARHRLKVTGVVSYQLPGHALYLQDDAGDGLRVQTSSTAVVAPGSIVEAVGFPVAGDYAPVLSDGIFRIVGRASPPRAISIQAAQVITLRREFNAAAYDQQLVQLQGRVVEARSEGGQRIWTLQQDGKNFEASLPPAAHLERTETMGAGSILLLTGVCRVQVDFDRNPVAFAILLRSPKDIVVLRRASWWTAGHLLLLIIALSVLVLLVMLWVAMLRSRVKHQTTRLLESEQRFRYLATHDSLTQLPNRASILATLGETLDSTRAYMKGVCVAVLDIDHFKHINDTFGHHAGDQVLCEVALRLSSSIREDDMIGRYGGEEFLIVFRNMDQEIGLDRCEALRNALCSRTISAGERELTVSCSIGISGTLDRSTPAYKLIAQADEALYRAKKDGRNRVECFSPSPSWQPPSPRLLQALSPN